MFHGGSPTAHFALMGTIMIVLIHPRVQILLQRCDILVNFLTERHLIEFLQYGFMKAFADTVGLRRSGFRLGMLNIVDGQV